MSSMALKSGAVMAGIAFSIVFEGSMSIISALECIIKSYSSSLAGLCEYKRYGDGQGQPANSPSGQRTTRGYETDLLEGRIRVNVFSVEKFVGLARGVCVRERWQGTR